MWDRKKEAVMMSERRETFLESGFKLFSSKNIDTVSLQEVADESGLGVATLYRYFVNKPGLVVAVATWKWEEYLKENKARRPSANFEGMKASEIFEFYLDSFLELYRNHRDMLRFNQFFNVYVQAEHIDPDVMEPYKEIIYDLKEFFHEIYLKAQEDHTVRTDEPEEQMFSTTLHLMLAAVTRYAVGLVYTPQDGFDAQAELETMKEIFLVKYTV
ncbi:MAG: TetR/AcrR family transcriptional regulator [Lachnospiraceae bacterium]|nr:TetR/AcrR family transcriptional regulator [Lachnospiraceae bacterium]